MESGAETPTPPKLVTADSWWQQCPESPFTISCLWEPQSRPVYYPFPACSSAFPLVLWATRTPVGLFQWPSFSISCLESVFFVCNQRTLDATVGVSLCLRRGVRAAIGQFQRVSPATTATLLLKRWVSKEQGGRNKRAGWQEVKTRICKYWCVCRRTASWWMWVKVGFLLWVFAVKLAEGNIGLVLIPGNLKLV